MKLEVFDRHDGAAAKDPEQIQFAADLAWLKAHGVEMVRVDAARDPEAFAAHPMAQKTLQEKGAGKLPFFFVNGLLVGSGYYPSRKQLAQVIDLASGGAPEKLLSDGASCCGPEGCCE